jgi:hypothetical protein
MKQNKVTERQQIVMDIELYQCKKKYLEKVQSYKDLIGIKLRGYNEDFDLTQDNLPFSMQMELKILIKDSIDYYQHQIEFLTQLLNTKNLLENESV